MNPQKSSARRAEEGIAYAGELDNQVSPLEEVVVGDQVSVAPPPMEDGDIRASFLKMSHDNTTQAQVITTEAQTMTDLHNWEVVPRGNQQVSTMASCLTDFTRTYPPSLYGSEVEDSPKSSFMKFTSSFILWGRLIVRRPSYPLTNSKMWPKLSQPMERK
ncbi:hypothetical protein EJD97_013073 [Solanum chilense]|uniref:Uncharacterized protein n=1 Tax=Solanum chilense TaxID=4083 RepID=A0A6N2BBW1_SOLCI|nr:hypothetical protein EJD97_013073 [Solanum chilense]